MASITCPSCGKQVSDQDNVCMYCGYKLKNQVKFCAKCGAKIVPGSAFCAACGNPVENKAPVQLPGAVAVAGGEQLVQRLIVRKTVPKQQIAQQVSAYQQQAEMAQKAVEQQPIRQQMAQQASEYQKQANLGHQAADYQQQAKVAHEAMELPKQEMAHQADDYQQQAKIGQEVAEQPKQEMAQQASDYQRQTEIARETMEQHVSHSATLGARQAAKMGVETGKIAAKHVTQSVGNMLWLKIVAIVTSVMIITGGIIGGTIWIHRSFGNRKRTEEDTIPDEPHVVEESLIAPEEDMPEPEELVLMEEIDPDEFDPEAKNFLMYFGAFYKTESRKGSQEFDSENPDNGILKSIVVSWDLPCVDLMLYPGEGRNVVEGVDPQYWWAQEDDYGYLHYAVYDAYEVDWILEHVFHIPNDKIESFLQEAESEHLIYRWNTERSQDYCSKFIGVPRTSIADSDDYYDIQIESVKTDGDKFYVTYNRWHRYDPGIYGSIEDEYEGDFFAIMAQEEIDGKTYWTMYYHTADVPYESEPAPELFSMFASDLVGEADTQLRIEKDGTFAFHDDYFSDCHGRFVNPRRINSYTYAFDVGEVTYDDSIDESLSGMDQGEVFYVYLPETPQNSLPFMFRQQLRWVFGQYSPTEEKLGFLLIANEDPWTVFAEYRDLVMGY